MFCSIKNTIRLWGALSTILLLMISGSANAASYDMFSAGTSNLLGTFEAPAAGGEFTAISFSISGITFDVLGTGAQAPTYFLTDNDVDGMSENSMASGICGVGECFLSFFTKADAMTPGEWAVDKLVPGDYVHITGGYYDIEMSVVPLPSSLLLFGSALIGLGLVRRRWNRKQKTA